MIKIQKWPLRARQLLIFGLFLILPLLILNTVLATPIKLPTDSYYHISRIANLSGHYLGFLYPQNFSTLGQFGITTNIFYPAQSFQILLNILPHFGAVTIYKLFMYLNIVLLLFSAYITIGFSYIQSEFYRVTFSIIFAFSIGISTGLIALGESMAFIGIPWLAIGLWILDKPTMSKRKAIFCITFGLCIAAYSHLMTFLFLAIFTAIYFLVLLLKSPLRIRILTVGVLSALLTFLSSLGSIVPVLVISHFNTVKPPVIDLHQFETSLISVTNFFSFSDNIDSFAIIFIIAVLLFLKVKPPLGAVMGIIMALLGTDLFSWSQLMKHSFLQSMQMPARLFRPGIGLTLMFVFFGFSLVEERFHSSFFKPTVALLTIMLTINTTATVRGGLFPDIDGQGKFQVMSKAIVDTGVSQHVGLGVTSLGAVNDNIVQYSPFWYLYLYPDYMPIEAIAKNAKEERNLGPTEKEQSLPNHQLLDANNHFHAVTAFHADLKKISFSTTDKIEAGRMQLPVLGYHGLSVDVYVRGKHFVPKIVQGKLSVKIPNSIRSGSPIVIRQHIPLFSAISNLISAITLLSLFSWILFRYIFSKQSTQKTKVSARLN